MHRTKTDIDRGVLLGYRAAPGCEVLRPADRHTRPAASCVARRVAASAGLANDQSQFQMLYGVRLDLQDQLVRAGLISVRCYVPYWSAMGTSMRRPPSRCVPGGILQRARDWVARVEPILPLSGAGGCGSQLSGLSTSRARSLGRDPVAAGVGSQSPSGSRKVRRSSSARSVQGLQGSPSPCSSSALKRRPRSEMIRVATDANRVTRARALPALLEHRRASGAVERPARERWSLVGPRPLLVEYLLHHTPRSVVATRCGRGSPGGRP